MSTFNNRWPLNRKTPENRKTERGRGRSSGGKENLYPEGLQGEPKKNREAASVAKESSERKLLLQRRVTIGGEVAIKRNGPEKKKKT